MPAVIQNAAFLLLYCYHHYFDAVYEHDIAQNNGLLYFKYLVGFKKLFGDFEM